MEEAAVGEVLRALANGTVMRFDDTKTTPDVMDRVVAYENTKYANENDTAGGTVDKSVRTLVRGTGEGIAQTGDLPHVAGHWLGQVMKNAWEEGHGRPYERTASDWPLTEAYNKAVVPVQPGYETMNDVTAMIAPAVIESVATLGAGAPAAVGSTLMRSAGQMTRAGGNIARRAATTTGLGYVGGQTGGYVGEKIGGDTGREVGQFVGSLAAAPAASLTKAGIKAAYFDPKSPETLGSINRLNKPIAEGGAEANIPVTAGILSPKRLGAKEDQLARQPIIGKKVIETRRGQYGGIDEAKKNVIEQIRGKEAGGPITRESLGMDIRNMLADTDTTVSQKMEGLQNKLAQDVLLMTPTDALEIHRTLTDLAKDETLGADLNSQAKRLRQVIQRNYKISPTSDMGPPSPTMTYGATKQTRSRLGQQLPKETLGKQVDAPAYKSLTEMMRDTAEGQGITNFDDLQTRYSNWAKQRDAVRELQGKGTDPEAGAYSSLVGGGSKGSVEQFGPYREHASAALDQILADALELNTRGPNAGRSVDPELVDPKAMSREWGQRSDEFKNFYTHGNPTFKRLLDDITKVSQAEAARAGKRSVPGGPGSTIGEGQNPQTGLNAILANQVAGPLGAILSLGSLPAYRAVKSRMLTNEPAIQNLFQKEPLGTSLARGVAGSAAGSQRGPR
jgi:hypothetical protein